MTSSELTWITRKGGVFRKHGEGLRKGAIENAGSQGRGRLTAADEMIEWRCLPRCWPRGESGALAAHLGLVRERL